MKLKVENKTDREINFAELDSGSVEFLAGKEIVSAVAHQIKTRDGYSAPHLDITFTDGGVYQPTTGSFWPKGAEYAENAPHREVIWHK